MTRATLDIEFTRGDDVVRLFSWQDDNGDTIDTTGRTYAAQIRTNPDAPADWVFTPSLDGAAGQLTLTMAAAITATIPPGRQYWDIEETIDGVKSTVFGGRATVWPDVTR